MKVIVIPCNCFVNTHKNWKSCLLNVLYVKIVICNIYQHFYYALELRNFLFLLQFGMYETTYSLFSWHWLACTGWTNDSVYVFLMYFGMYQITQTCFVFVLQFGTYKIIQSEFLFCWYRLAHSWLPYQILLRNVEVMEMEHQVVVRNKLIVMH